MKNIQTLLAFLIIFSTISSCEIDDICTEKVLTPKLIIKFYDTSNVDLSKKVDTLTVWAINKDSLYKKSETDSIAIPLNHFENSTKYILQSNDILDTLYIFHENEEVFVSRSCGIKFNFTLGENTDLSNHWTSNFELITHPQTIKNENEVHLKIYH